MPLLETASAATSVDATVVGTTSDTAAGSCWEIKQARPSAADGTYWLLTPKMLEPQQFYCDMTTDGGGWVLVGKGRNGWTNEYDGQRAASELTTSGLSPMSARTTQLPSSTIDALLNGGRVDALSEGIRLRRAKDAAGNTWQEARFKLSSRDRWAWTFGAEHPLASWSFDATTGSGGITESFGSQQSYNRVHNVPIAAQKYAQAFAYGSSVTGTSATDSYLWSSTSGGGNAIPYTQVYLRPRVLSSDAGFTTIPDAGTVGYEQQSVARSNALNSPWGVSGLAGNTEREGAVEVQAFTQSGDTMYVGGNFRYAQRDELATDRVEQPFLAAFSVSTGEWVSTFRPVLNEQVKTLATLPNGSVLAGGEFTVANGLSRTIIALDPVTGATDPSFNLTAENRRTDGVNRIEVLRVVGDYVYVGGSITHLLGGPSMRQAVATNMGRASVTDGLTSTDWNPNFNGTVMDVDGTDDGGRVFAVGFFSTAGGANAKRAAAISTAPGAALASTSWNPTWSSSTDYQQAVDVVGPKAWVGGSEHSLFQFDVDSYARTMGDIMKKNGDLQDITAAANGIVYAGCHCNNFDYANAYTWPTLSAGWKQADAMNWVGAWDSASGKRVPQFTPVFSMRLGSGVWAIQPDDSGVLWVGGDITNVQTSNQANRFSGGFARFPLRDSAAPTTPTNFRITAETGTEVTLAWNTTTDPSGAGYQILRDDRPIASTKQGSITVPKGGQNRFFVRTSDGAGNVSATTSVIVSEPLVRGAEASFTHTVKRSVASFDGSGSSSGTGDVETYAWTFGDGSTGTGVAPQHTYAAAGSYSVTLTITDSTGAQDSVTHTVQAGTPAGPAPTDSFGRKVYDQEPYVFYRLAEASGSTAVDSGPDVRNGTWSGSSWTRAVAGALVNSDNKAASCATGFLGGSCFVASPSVGTSPNAFSIGVWFKSTSTSGGRLIGFSSSATGTSSSYDRHLQLQNNGQVQFGVAPNSSGQVKLISPASYNNGAWHQAVGTFSTTGGMRLYIDGQLVGTNSNTTIRSYTGFWKVGGDNVWSGSSNRYLNGTLDEAAVFHRVLSDSEVADQFRLARTVPIAPEAAFTSSVDEVTVDVDGSASTDPDGSIASYAWNFGDGATASGPTATHTYADGGTYTVTLTVTDNDGATDSVSHDVQVQDPPVTTDVVQDADSWRWRYVAEAPPSGWNQPAFDASGWNLGGAVLGFGDPSVVTNIDTFATTSERPKVAYFLRSFQVADTTKVTRLVLDTVADDGAVVYVNGVEVGRQNMPAGAVDHTTFASSARRTNVAESATFVIEVPTSLLVNGANVIAVETHLNFRGTADVSFHLRASLTRYE
ncbi:MAG TPA: PKD domain-containing protein [Nocardioidaceae bacterium]|nr:PKD domain-containing protein [Nocardioidaceae bacterium]